MQASGLTEIIPLFVPQLSGASILLFLTLRILMVPHFGVVSDWLLEGGHPVSILSSLRAHCLEAVI